MSFEAMKWASQQNAGGSTNKLVLLLLANYADQEYQCFPSIKKLAEMTECSTDTVRRAVHNLRNAGLIEIRERYEAFGDKKRQTSNIYILKAGDSHSATHPPSDIATPPLAKPLDHITNQNNQSIYTDDFMDFWKAYPKRPNSSKRNAFKKYQIALRNTKQQELLNATKQFAKTQINTDPQYIPHAATWLHQERYVDIMDEPKLKPNRNRIAG